LALPCPFSSQKNCFWTSVMSPKDNFGENVISFLKSTNHVMCQNCISDLFCPWDVVCPMFHFLHVSFCWKKVEVGRAHNIWGKLVETSFIRLEFNLDVF
jgi:hypothetical protein